MDDNTNNTKAVKLERKAPRKSSLYQPPSGYAEIADQYLWKENGGNVDNTRLYGFGGKQHSRIRQSKRSLLLSSSLSSSSSSSSTSHQDRCSGKSKLRQGICNPPPTYTSLSSYDSSDYYSRQQIIQRFNLSGFDDGGDDNKKACFHRLYSYANAVGFCARHVYNHIMIYYNRLSASRKKFVIVALLIVTVFVPLLQGPLNDDSHNITVALQTPQEERSTLIQSRLVQEGVSDPSHFTIPTSPQSKALQWILNKDPMQLEPNGRDLIDRYALAVFYHSMNTTTITTVTENDNHTNSSLMVPERPWDDYTWMTNTSVCDWNGVLCDYTITNSNGTQIIGLNVTDVTGNLPGKELAVLVSHS